MNIVHIGSSTALSLIPLRALLESKHVVQAIVADDRGHRLDARFPVFDTSRSSLESLAFTHGIPLVRAASDWSACAEQIRRYSPDVIFVSCFSHRLPEEVCAISARGCINLHPSLLPAHRGPDPVFWQFRDGDDDFGVSLHHISSELDAGPVLAQRRVSMADGIAYSAACYQLAEAGRDLLLATLDRIEHQLCPGQPQDETQASYQSFPAKEDFILSTDWTAKRMYNFICAMQERGVHYPCVIHGHTYYLTKAFSYQTGGKTDMAISHQRINVHCQDGSVEAGFLLE